MKGCVDLHIHSTASDGTLPPTELVKYAVKKHLKAIAITDHDTTDGVEEALEAGKINGIEVVPGIELSADYEGELHILGLYINYKDEKFQEQLNVIKKQRTDRNPKLLEKLNQLGFNISMQEVESEAGGEIVARPHFASVLMKKGYIKSIEEGFDKYLGYSKPAYVEREKVTPEKAIKIILSAGGIPIIAHPGLLEKSPQETERIVADLVKVGLKGVEVFHSSHNEEATKLLLHIAKKYKMVISGGSDFHGLNRTSIADMGCVHVRYEYLEQIKHAAGLEVLL